MKRAFLLLLVLTVSARCLSAQERGGAALGELVQALGTTSRVLVIGAHPDDEDTQLIAWLAKGRHVETAYLSLTRGDGGQNLIGNELGEMLGMIRTEELLAARRLDGGRQYFTRAYDFGFSKNAEETLMHWPKDSILKDLVAIVRAFRPHVIISMWTGTRADGHGHHEVSGILAREAFDAAADGARFPAAQVGGLPPWTTAKFYRSRAYRAGAGTPLRVNVGEYSPLFGRSYSEIASESRSKHRSQGQGELENRGARLDAVRLEVSRVSTVDTALAEQTIFDAVDTSWARFKPLALPPAARAALESLTVAQTAVTRSLDLVDPSRMVVPLARYVRLANTAIEGVTCHALPVGTTESDGVCSGQMADLALALARTHERATDALVRAAGVAVEATAPREVIAERDSMPVTISVYNQGKAPVVLERATLGSREVTGKGVRAIRPDDVVRDTAIFHAPSDPTVPWWLSRKRIGDVFQLTDRRGPPGAVSAEMILGEDRLATSSVTARVRIADVTAEIVAAPIVYRFADATAGERRRPIAVVPEIAVLLEHEVEYARANWPLDRSLLVHLESATSAPREVEVSLDLPAGLTADTAKRIVSLKAFGSANVYFRLRGRLAPGRTTISASARISGGVYNVGYVPIEYEHIRPQRYYRPADMALEAVNATYASSMRIGYVRGVGDNVEPMLEQLGIPVTMLDPRMLERTDLSRFTTLVVGTRAFAASDALVARNGAIMQFARNGGTVVTQYGQTEMTQPGMLPFPITLARPADRVTEERAPVRVLDPASPLLSSPNRIGDADFASWVQERALYMPRTFDLRYRTVFSMNDTNEPPNDAAVLVAPVGKGVYIYTTLAFFRQLPAGNPGAARLFINLLSADHRAAAGARPATSAPVRP